MGIDINKLVEDVFTQFPLTGQNKSELVECLEIITKKPLYNCLEIGTQYGGTFYLWQQICQGKIISIDLPDGVFGGVSNERHLDRNQKLKKENSFFITGNSQCKETQNKFTEILDGEKLDLLFIDGDHSFDGVKTDYEFYSKFVNPDGFIVFHDIGDNKMNTTTSCECKKFFDSLPNHKIIIDHKTSWAPSGEIIGGIGIIKP